ncbi:hypothetical protein MM809_33515, partial [Klebsiella pneumoniae]|nr:hypothetical protein [Klebsiella pneumoniae]
MGLPLSIQNLCSLILLNFTNKKTARLFSSSNFKFVVYSGWTVAANGSYSFAVSDFIGITCFGKVLFKILHKFNPFLIWHIYM